MSSCTDWATEAIDMGAEEHLRDALALICDLRRAGTCSSNECAALFAYAYQGGEWDMARIVCTSGVIQIEDLEKVVSMTLSYKYMDHMRTIEFLSATFHLPPYSVDHFRPLQRTKFMAQRFVQLHEAGLLHFVLQYVRVEGVLVVELCQYAAFREDPASLQMLLESCHPRQHPWMLCHAADQSLNTFKTVLGALDPEKLVRFERRTMCCEAALRRAAEILDYDFGFYEHQLCAVNSIMQRLEIVKIIVTKVMPMLLTPRERHDAVANVLAKANAASSCIHEYLKECLSN